MNKCLHRETHTLAVFAQEGEVKILLTPIDPDNGRYRVSVLFRDPAQDPNAQGVVVILNRDQAAEYLREVFGKRSWSLLFRRALERSTALKWCKDALREILAVFPTESLPERVLSKKK